MRKGFMLALLSIPVGMVLAAVVSYLSWGGVPYYVFLAPGAVAGYASVWLFRRKVDAISWKGLVRLAIVSAVSGVALVGGALIGDTAYITSKFGSEHISLLLSAVIKDNVVWYAMFIVCNFAGLFGALRTLK